jgi:molecular chaperone IbpA
MPSGSAFLLTRLNQGDHMNFKAFHFPNDSLKSLDPFVIGFDKVFQQLEDLTTNTIKNTPNWPPYNIKKVNDNKYVIEMAVAGFTKSDIEISLEGDKLNIKGLTKESESDISSYVFRGIANRSFHRTFTLADKVEIRDAELSNGMLRIWLENLYQTQNTVKKIAIK